MLLEDLLLQHGQSLHQTFTLGKEQVCSLQVGEDIVINISPACEKSFFFYSELCDLSSNEDILARLMEAHLFGIETADAVFSVDCKSKKIIIHQRVLLQDLCYNQYIELFQAFTGTTLHWKEKIPNIRKEFFSNKFSLENHLKDLRNQDIRVIMV